MEESDIDVLLDYLFKSPRQVEEEIENLFLPFTEAQKEKIEKLISLFFIADKMQDIRRGTIAYSTVEPSVYVVGHKPFDIHSKSKEVNLSAGRMVEGYIIENQFLIIR